MTAAALALLLLAPADTYVRQYAHTDYLSAIIERPGELEGVHILDKCTASGDVDACDLTNSRTKAEAARAQGLRVMWGFRTGADYDDPAQWENAARLVRRGAGIGTERTIVLDVENYWHSGGAECRLGYAEAFDVMEPLVRALKETGNAVAIYPASSSDTCAAVLWDSVGGEAWTEHAFSQVGKWARDRVGWRVSAEDDSARDEALRRRFPGVLIRTGYFDEAARDVYADAPRAANAWIFDSSRGRVEWPPGSGQMQNERSLWGTPEWHTAQTLSSLNDPAHVFQAYRRGAITRWVADPAHVNGLRWDRKLPTQVSEEPPPISDLGAEVERHWHHELNIPNADERTVSFEVVLADDVTGPYPVAGSWLRYACCKVWLVYVEDGLLKLAIGQGERRDPPAYTFGGEALFTIGPAIAGERVRVVVGWDENSVKLPGHHYMLAQDTNNIRSRIYLGYTSDNTIFVGEDHSHPPDGNTYVGQLVVWDRLLTDAEMVEAQTGRYPWGL